jgi:hypothetical protein
MESFLSFGLFSVLSKRFAISNKYSALSWEGASSTNIPSVAAFNSDKAFLGLNLFNLSVKPFLNPSIESYDSELPITNGTL